MDPQPCAYCGGLVEDQGIRHRRKLFCSDECCEAFEDEFMRRGEPDPVDLDEPFDDLDPLDEELDPDDDLDPLDEELDLDDDI